jgi:hypothetical protein
LESGTGRPLNLRGISTFISILNFRNSLINQSDQTVIILNRPSCLIPSPSLQNTTTTRFLSCSTFDWVHVCLLSMIFHFASLHLPPSVRLSVSPSPGCLPPNHPITQWPSRPSEAIGSNSFSRSLLSTLGASATTCRRAAPEHRRCLHSPGHPEQLPDSQYRRRTRRSRVCFLWDCVKIRLLRHNPFMLSGDFGKWASETGSHLAHKVIKFHVFAWYFFPLLYHTNTSIHPLSRFISYRPQSHKKRRPGLNLLLMASHYNLSLQPDSPTLRPSLNPASAPIIPDSTLRGNAPPVTNEVFCGIRTDNKDVE